MFKTMNNGYKTCSMSKSYKNNIDQKIITSHETSLSISPDAIEPVTLDQNEVLLGTIGPLCDTPISSNMCGIDSVSTPAGEPKLIYCIIKFVINLLKTDCIYANYCKKLII